MKTHHDIATSMNVADKLLREAKARAESEHDQRVAAIRRDCCSIGHLWRWVDTQILSPAGMYCAVCDEAHGDNG